MPLSFGLSMRGILENLIKTTTVQFPRLFPETLRWENWSVFVRQEIGSVNILVFTEK